MDRFRQLLEAQVGNLIVQLCEKEAQILSLTERLQALSDELAKLKPAEGADGAV